MKTIEEIAIECASKSGHSYTDVENFKPHNWVLEAMHQYAKQCCEQQIGEFGFGSLCSVEQKRYGAENEFYTYKVVNVIRSNYWVDVPVDARVNKAVSHNSIEDVVTCICMGVYEDTVTRFKLSEVIQLSTPNVAEKP